MQDEQQVEDTTASPSEAENTASEPQNDSEVEKTPDQDTSSGIPPVPYDRFKEVLAEKNAYKELLMAKQNVPEPQSEVNPTQDVEDALKIVDKRIEEKLARVKAELDLKETASKYPDFYKYADMIKAQIEENPHLKWEQAYILARAGVSQEEAINKGKEQAYKTITAKKAGVVESGSKVKAARVATPAEIDPMAKGPDGKFLYSTKELESILPQASK